MTAPTDLRLVRLERERTELEQALADATSKLTAQETELRTLRTRPAFGLVFEDQPEQIVDECRDKLPVLTEMPSRRVISPAGSGNGPAHLLIEGDNYHALTALQYTHAGKVDVIYIDPPYNTGNKDFRYNDRFVDKDDAWRHSSWLSFMGRRLRLARTLLKDTGVILLSIDQHELPRLWLMCEQIFGAANFITDLIWNGGRKNDSRFVSNGHEYMLVFAKSKPALIQADIRWREQKPGLADIQAAAKAAWDESGGDPVTATANLKAWFKGLPVGHPALGSKHYNHVDERGVFFPADISWPGGGGPTYEVLHPTTGKPVSVPARGWVYGTPERMAEMVAAGRVHFGPNENKVPNKKSYLADIDSMVAESVFARDRRASNKELRAIIGAGKFNFPKNTDVIARWLSIVGAPDAVVLDFFAGSGTTGHAVAQLNSMDGGTRQAILVTNNENDICTDVTLPRLRTVLTGNWDDGEPHDPILGELRYYRTHFVPGSNHVDTVRARLASGAVDLIAIRENAYDEHEATPGRSALLTGDDRVVAVWAAPDTTGLIDLHEAAVDLVDDRVVQRVLYCYTSDDAEPDLTGAGDWDGWRVEPIPAHLLAALRATH